MLWDGNTVGQAAAGEVGSVYGRGSTTEMMSGRRNPCRHPIFDDSEEANGNRADNEPEPEPEELDWDSYSTTLEHRIAAVGKAYIKVKHILG